MIAKATISASASRRIRSTGRASKPAVRASSAAERDAMLSQHIGLVHHVARQMANRLSSVAELDELVSAGTMGLIQAVDSFDRSRGLSLSTYAVPRIRGAILDELRKQDHVPRNVRRRSRDVARAQEALVGSLRRLPTHDEVSQHMQIPTDVLRKWEFDAEGASLSSLDQPMRADSAGVTLGDTISDDRVGSLDDLLTHEQEVGRLQQAIGTLKEQERTVLALNFFEELKLQEIATVLRLSVCRISQIRTAALAKLRVALSDLRVA